jgi:hypothetical protein
MFPLSEVASPFARGAGGTRSATGGGSRSELEPVGSPAGGGSGLSARALCARPTAHLPAPAPGSVPHPPLRASPPPRTAPAPEMRRAGSPREPALSPGHGGWATIATGALPVFSTTSPDVQQVRSQPRRQAARDSSPEPSFRRCPGRKKRTNSTCATSIECGILQIVVEGA